MTSFLIRVWGPRARFTAPHTRAEPYTEDCMTPSAGHRLLTTIYAKPEMHWLIDEINVMKPIRKENSVVKGPGKSRLDSTLQTTTDLLDVEYVIRARVAINPARTDDLKKYIGESARRLSTGQRHQPLYLGIREYPAYYELLDPGTEVRPIEDTRPLGSILYANVPVNFATDTYESVFFNGWLRNGTLNVPDHLHTTWVPKIMAQVHQRIEAQRGAL